MIGNEDIDALRKQGYVVEKSKTQNGRYRWWRDTGSDGASVPKTELSEVTFASEVEAWSGAKNDSAIVSGVPLIYVLGAEGVSEPSASPADVATAVGQVESPIGFKTVTGERFFLITDFEKVEQLKAQSYEAAFEEIEGRGGVTWVATEGALRQLQAQASAALLANGHQNLGTHQIAASGDGASTANVADELGQAQADEMTAICRSTITFQVLHDAAAIPLLVNPHLNYIAHECDAGGWIGGRVHVSTSPALTRDQLVAACGELGGSPDFFSDAWNDDGDFPAMTAFMSTHEVLLGELASRVAAIGGPDGVLEEKLDDAADELKGRLGADAANQQESREDQEEAISQAEAWVAEHVANGSLADRLSAVLWLQGEVGARQLVEAARERFFSNAVQRPRG